MQGMTSTRTESEPSGNSRYLVPVRTSEEAREKGARGGRASGAARRKKASLRRAAELVLSMDAADPFARETMAKMGLEEDELTNASMITAQMVLRASAGDVAAYSALMRNFPDEEPDEDPAEAVPLIDTASLVPGCYADMWRDIMAGGHSEYIGESGRGSLKSTVLGGEAPIMLMLRDPKLCGVAFRQVANTMRDSIFATMASAIARLGVEDQFVCTVSPMMIRRKTTGQVVLFRGLDDPEKAKSLQLQDPGKYIGFAVWEEFDQFRGERQMRRVQQTVKRGGAPHFWTFRMFNTPANDAHWAHQYTLRQEERGEAMVARCTYLDVPREFLGEEFHADAEALKEIDPEAHANEYLGECTGRKGKVFANLERREVTAEERLGLKWIRCGVDWGYVRDPWVFLQVGYDAKTKTLYILQEDKGLRLSDEQTAERVRRRLTEVDDEGRETFLPRAPRNRIYADSAEQKSVASYRACGLDCVGARKWPGSVEQGVKWMQTRARIVIDRDCPLAWAEFSAYDYEQDPDGEPIEDAYPDKDNHTIDAARYAASPLIADRKEV